jgi:hypothetical protein
MIELLVGRVGQDSAKAVGQRPRQHSVAGGLNGLAAAWQASADVVHGGRFQTIFR